MPDEVLRVQSRRAARQRRMQIGQHLLAALLLITAGMGHGANSILAIAEIVSGGLLIVTVIRERRRPGGHHGGVAWVELAGAVMTTVEAVEKTGAPHHISFIVLTFVQPLVLFLFAIFDARIAESRYIKAGDEMLEIKLRLFFRRRVKWSDIRSFRVAADSIELEGAKALKLRDVVDRDAAIQWIVEQMRRRGIAASAAG